MSISMTFCPPPPSSLSAASKKPILNRVKLSGYTTASEFCVWVEVGIDVYIPHHKYQVKPHSYSCFSPACAAAIAHRNLFVCLYQQTKSSEYKVKFGQASNH